MNRRSVLVGAGALALTPVAAVPVMAGKAEIFTGLLSWTAAGGYDVVAYFTEGRPVEGRSEFTTEWKGATWRFASRENLEAFKVDPEAFAPQYGGYCAYGVSEGYAVKGEPEIWKIVAGKLYLNYSKAVQKSWEEDIPGHIAKADANWPKVLE